MESIVDERVKNLTKRRSFLQMTAAAVPAAIVGSTVFPKEAEAAAANVLYFNVRDPVYGSYCDGVNDDAPAFNNAIAAAKAAGGGVVLVPAGYYLINTTINLAVGDTPVTLEGAGPGDVTFPTYTLPSPPWSSLTPKGTSLVVTGTIDAILVSGNRAIVRRLAIYSSTPRTAGRGIYANGNRNVLIEDVDTKNQFIGIEVNQGFMHRVERCLLAGSGATSSSYGFVMNGNSTTADSNDTYVNEVYISGVGIAFHILHTGSIVMSRCASLSCNYGLVIEPGTGQVVKFSFFTDCVWDVSAADCMRIIPLGTGSIRAINFTQCWSASSTSGNLCTIGGNVDGVQFVGHRFFNCSVGNGLWVTGPVAQHIYVDSCIATTVSNGGGFVFVNGAQKFAVRNSHSGIYYGAPTNKWGIYVDNTCSKYVLTGCVLEGNSTSNLIDGGAAPKVVVNNLSI
jgi:hypothetical protein